MALKNGKGLTTAAKKRAFIDAMKKTFGNVTQSCQIVGIGSRNTPYDWAKKDPKFAAQFDSNIYVESYKDAIESKLAKLGLQEENPTVLIFLAKTKAKDRGYIERQEMALTKDSIIEVGFDDDENEDDRSEATEDEK